MVCCVTNLSSNAKQREARSAALEKLRGRNREPISIPEIKKLNIDPG